ncbi:hypothetical protein COOONC_00296 [Cooperia oncophora]
MHAEQRPYSFQYATCLMIILATEIAAAIYTAMHSHMFENDFREILRASLRMYNGTDSSDKRNVDGMLVKAAWDKLMHEKFCCGVDSKEGEFNESGWFRLTNGRHMFPPACCPQETTGKMRPDCQPYARHTDDDTTLTNKQITVFGSKIRRVPTKNYEYMAHIV